MVTARFQAKATNSIDTFWSYPAASARGCAVVSGSRLIRTDQTKRTPYWCRWPITCAVSFDGHSAALEDCGGREIVAAPADEDVDAAITRKGERSSLYGEPRPGRSGP